MEDIAEISQPNAGFFFCATIFKTKQVSTMSEPIKFPAQPKFSKEQELYSRLYDLVHEYDGELSMVAVVGIVELLKLHVVESCA